MGSPPNCSGHMGIRLYLESNYFILATSLDFPSYLQATPNKQALTKIFIVISPQLSLNIFL